MVHQRSRPILDETVGASQSSAGSGNPVFHDESRRSIHCRGHSGAVGWRCAFESREGEARRAGMIRTATIRRETAETKIALTLKIDGSGESSIATKIPFFDHMLTLF